MNLKEFTEYVQKNCRAQEIFLIKSYTYLKVKNDKRQAAAKWNDSRLEKESENMWQIAVQNLYNTIATNIKQYDMVAAPYNKWAGFMAEFEVLDGFTDGIGDMEFED